MQDSNSLSKSNDFQQPRKDGLTDKFRQKITAVGKRVQRSSQGRTFQPDLSCLTPRSQELLLHAVNRITREDSENVMIALDESRDLLRNSFEEFKREQEEYRNQLEEISKLKQAALARSKENAIPLSIIMRQKRNTEGLADLRPNSSINYTYQAYFSALLLPDQNKQQHPTDKAAVIKYIRRRERRKRAEENKQNHQLSDDNLVKQTTELMQKMEGLDIQLENERQRQNEILRVRMNEKKFQTNHIIQANEIIDQANEADLARQRVEQIHREKIEARLSAIRRDQNRSPSNLIHVQPHFNENDDEKLTDEQIEMNKKSLQLLNENDRYQQRNSSTPIYGDTDTNDQVADIQI